MDIVAAIPWEWIGHGDMKAARGIRIVKALRLLRLMRLARLLRLKSVTEKLEVFIESNKFWIFFTGLARVLLLIFGITHWAACAWYGLGDSTVASPDSTPWTDVYLSDGDDKFQRYISALYFTLTTMTTVGYGDMSAQNHEERVFVLFLLLIASIFFAGLMGVLTDLISNFNSETNARNEQKAVLSRYMHWRAVPKALFLEIRSHMIFLWDANEGFEEFEQEIKAQLPPLLQMELCYHIYGRVLYLAPFLTWMRDYSLCLKQLSTMVQSIFLSKGDLLFRVGQPNEQIYMLINGSVWVTRNEGLDNQEEGSAHEDLDLEQPHLMIPRNKEAGLGEVGSVLMHQVQRIKPKHEAVQQDVLKNWGKGFDDSQMKADLKRKYGGGMQGIFAPDVLINATIQLKCKDARQRRAAAIIQRKWRKKAKHIRGSVSFKAVEGRDTKPVSAMQSKTVQAPAYFGESCLWAPIEQWRTADPPRYNYTARCQSRGELVYIPRESIQVIIERFSPWLGERFECFQQAVVAGLEAMITSGAGTAMAAPMSQWLPADAAAMDLCLMPGDDDAALSAMHCKTLLRAAVPSQQSLAALRTASSGQPAMPRVPTMTLSDGPATPSIPRRINSGLQKDQWKQTPSKNTFALCSEVSMNKDSIEQKVNFST